MKKIKKVLALIFSSVMVLSLVSCGGSNTQSTNTVSGEKQAKKVSIATGGTSGTYYGFSGVVANVLTEKTGITFTTESTGASKVNVQLVDAGESQIAILQNDVMSYAFNATDMFKGENKVQSFSAIASVYPEEIQIVARKGINNVAELKGCKVSVGDAGSGTEFNARQILEAYGLDIEKDIIKNNQSFADSADSIKNGSIDAAFVTAGSPTVAITELSSTYDFNLVSMDDAHIGILQSKYPFYTKTPIAANTYKPVTTETNGVAVMATFIASNGLDEETVYQFTKGLFEYKSEFQHAKAALLDAKIGITGTGDVPFHPGAIKYYKEIGLMK
ncbi:MAG: TAXI family TRAP transporter solute-binding subunit [Eubacteriales bacterium]|nr:TAXI family TRAP transporter solute-binding subunit [Eubacteriales bacterium]